MLFILTIVSVGNSHCLQALSECAEVGETGDTEKDERGREVETNRGEGD